MDNTRAFEELDGSHVYVAHCIACHAWGDWYIIEFIYFKTKHSISKLPISTAYRPKYMFTLRKCNICGLTYINKNKVDAASTANNNQPSQLQNTSTFLF